MAETRRREHDFLRAALIVLSFGLVLGLVLLKEKDKSESSPEKRLGREAFGAIAQGDRFASDDVMDYERAREQYIRALDLLRSAPGDRDQLDQERAAVQVKIIKTYIEEGNYQKARERLEVLNELFPGYRPDEVQTLRARIDAAAPTTP